VRHESLRKAVGIRQKARKANGKGQKANVKSKDRPAPKGRKRVKESSPGRKPWVRLAGDELRGEWRQFGSDPVAAILKRVGAH